MGKGDENLDGWAQETVEFMGTPPERMERLKKILSSDPDDLRWKSVVLAAEEQRQRNVMATGASSVRNHFTCDDMYVEGEIDGRDVQLEIQVLIYSALKQRVAKKEAMKVLMQAFSQSKRSSWEYLCGVDELKPYDERRPDSLVLRECTTFGWLIFKNLGGLTEEQAEAAFNLSADISLFPSDLGKCENPPRRTAKYQYGTRVTVKVGGNNPWQCKKESVLKVWAVICAGFQALGFNLNFKKDEELQPDEDGEFGDTVIPDCD